ncbi:hypothetical protein A9K55_001339 [Cordyceps militaris]|uniref:Uncharacterized protein n=1 Tax=Cordyceps militaris TaxID=73501 RepID=A0A2H4SSP3_CORMI|nr:hypothetical protein A9K55_001339 [Cordyceps militaris]
MKPPPATPTPRRFLTKRPAPSSQLPHSTPTPLRFQSTPRFGSTQTRQVEEVDEIDVASSQSSAVVDGRDVTVSDSIEVDSYADSLASQAPRSSSSSSSDVEMEDDRRRLGYSSDRNEDAAATAHVERWEDDTGTPPVKRRRLSASASPPRLRMRAEYESDSDTGHYEENYESEPDDDVEDRTRTRPPAQQKQPTFQPAPRFRPVPEDDVLAQPDHGGPGRTLLAAHLSPRAAGARPISRAGSPRSCRGAEGGGDDGAAIIRLRVEEARPGARMHLVRGRGPAEDEGAAVQRYILAGGSGVRMVAEGCVLRIVPAPAWDVHLGEQWTVACDWSVESG